MPEEKGVHPYVEVSSDDAKEHLLLTACTAQQGRKGHGSLSVRRSGNEWMISGVHNGQTINVRLMADKDVPDVVIG